MPPEIKAKSSPEDVLQEVYVDVFRQIGRFEDRGPHSFLNWLYTILDRKLAATQRAAHAQRRDVGREVPAAVRADASSYWNLLEQVHAHSGTPSRVYRRREALAAVVTCVSGLSEAHRQVIQLRYVQELPVAEVAKRMGKSEAAVVALTRRALDALRASMDGLGEFTRNL